jgi:hypothetical protein
MNEVEGAHLASMPAPKRRLSGGVKIDYEVIFQDETRAEAAKTTINEAASGENTAFTETLTQNVNQEFQENPPDVEVTVEGAESDEAIVVEREEYVPASPPPASSKKNQSSSEPIYQNRWIIIIVLGFCVVCMIGVMVAALGFVAMQQDGDVQKKKQSQRLEQERQEPQRVEPEGQAPAQTQAQSPKASAKPAPQPESDIPPETPPGMSESSKGKGKGKGMAIHKARPMAASLVGVDSDSDSGVSPESLEDLSPKLKGPSHKVYGANRHDAGLDEHAQRDKGQYHFASGAPRKESVAKSAPKA